MIIESRLDLVCLDLEVDRVLDRTWSLTGSMVVLLLLLLLSLNLDLWQVRACDRSIKEKELTCACRVSVNCMGNGEGEG